MGRRHATIIAIALTLAVTAPAVYAGVKVQVCHIPPGNPSNFHTIKISEKAFSAHLAHGDLGGACDASCATLCDDGNACTIDDTGDCEQVGCPTTPEPVDCNDQNDCTADSCAPVEGCVNAPRVGEACDDGQICSGSDVCDAEGVCEGTEIENCCLDDSACSQNPCDQASCDLDTNRCIEDPVICDPPDLCTVSECAPDTGECVDSAVVCGEGERCDPCTGDCSAPACPCWTLEELDTVVLASPDDPPPYMAGFESLWTPEDFCNNGIDFDNLFAPAGDFPFEDFGCTTLNTLTNDVLVAFFGQDPPPWIPCQTWAAGFIPGAILWPFSPWFPEDEQPTCVFNSGDGCFRNYDITVEELAICDAQIQAQGSEEGWSCFASDPCSAVVCDEGETCNPATGLCEAACPCWTPEELAQVQQLPLDFSDPLEFGFGPNNHSTSLADYASWVPADACNDNLNHTPGDSDPTTCTAINNAPQAVLDEFCTEFTCPDPLATCDWLLASIRTTENPDGASAAFAVSHPEQFGGARCFFATPDGSLLLDVTAEELSVCQEQIQVQGATGGWSCF